jgi:ATP-binding cassette subfamily C (CFTR/MRP) protein 4
MPTHAGCIKVNGKISYASQEAWVFSGNLRQNILFGQPYHPDRYANVLEVCSLNRDIKGFDHGDQTMVGERGVALSGGQKARVNLARAIYREADIYLLDDPLSAVDSHVGRHLFDKCIKTFLKEKVVILVTHQLQYLKGADDILVLRQGKITHQGDYDSIVKSCTDISNFMTQEKDDDDDENVEKIKKIEVNCDEKVDQENEKAALLPSADKPAVDKNEEVSKIGNVSKNVYFGYLKSGANLCTGLVLTVATICTHGFFTLSDLWIAKWTNTEDVQLEQYQHHLFNDTLLTMENVTMDPSLLNDELQKEFHHIQESNQFNLMVYALLVLGLVIACSVQTVQYYVICMNASRNLHNKMFNKLLRAPPYFFDVNPSGRILNRFSKDMGCIDEVLPMTILDVKWLFLNIFCVFLLVIYIRPLVLIPTLVVAVIFVLLRKFYLQTSRSVKRIEGVTRSPVFSQLSTSLNGLTTIRAFKAQDMLVAEFDNIQDIHSSAWFTYLGTTRWFGVYLDWIVVIYLACCVLSFLLMPDDVLGGDVGVAISSCIFLTGALQYGMRQSAEAENLMTSVERVMEYGDLASEADLTSGNPDDESDKEQGIVEFDHVFLTYGLQSDAEKSSSSKAVLKDITFETKAQEKIGIVGRTGAGKSSLIVAIFRLSEPSGVIRIDGKDISKMGLHDLRKKISIIPQDPLLFTTSLRQNLDPFDQYSDADIWSALEQVNLSIERYSKDSDQFHFRPIWLKLFEISRMDFPPK